MFRDLGDLTADRLGHALMAAGVVTRPPNAATVEAIDDGAGFLGSLARVRLTWPDPDDGPASIIAKLPTTVPQNQTIVDRFKYDRREAGVYRDLRPWEKTSSPRALAQQWDDTTGRGWLLLEDLHSHTPGDGVAGATDAEARATVVALARWHGAYWNDPRLGSLDWLPASTDPLVAQYGMIFDLTWEICVDRLGGVDRDLEARIRQARAWFDTAVAEFAGGDRTLVHGDARLDNLRFESSGVDASRPGGLEAVLLDFQLAAHGRGIYDVAFFCAGSLDTEARRRLEPELLDLYRSTLATVDIHVDEAELWHDYRLGHMLNLPNPVSALAVVTPSDERGATFLRRNAERGLAAVADHVDLLH
jgi:Phosphotransferase enzyme family